MKVTNEEIKAKCDLEPGVYKAIKEHVKPGMSCIDVGAHVGCWTKVLLSLVQDKGRVYAYEPGTSAFTRLLNLVVDNKNLALTYCCVGDHVGTVKYWVSPDNSEQNSMYERVKGFTCEDRDCVNLDFDMLGIKIDFVKIDVEGYEYDVLKGMEQLILKNPKMKIVLEWNESCMTQAGHDVGDVYLYITEHLGLMTHDLGDGNWLLEKK